MVDDDLGPSRQLQDDLAQSTGSAITRTPRPILTHLNADTTFLLSLPDPGAVKRAGRSRFNILIDPWLRGPQSDVASWFSTQWHVIESSVQSIDELNSLLGESETLPAIIDTKVMKPPQPTVKSNLVDLVVISHEFTDHCHRATLQEISPVVPVFATQKAAALIRSWHHFERVYDVALFTKGMDWKATSHKSLPGWLGISRLVTPSDHLDYHSAIMFCVENSQEPNNAEAIVYTPHGIGSDGLAVLASARPPVQTLALVHGLHDVALSSFSIKQQLNLGADNALKAVRLLRPKYWVGTHDEVKRGGGIVSWFLRRKAHTLSDALSRETVEAKPAGTATPNFFDLASGASLHLE